MKTPKNVMYVPKDPCAVQEIRLDDGTCRRVLPQYRHEGRVWTIDKRLDEVRSLEYGKDPILLRGEEANKKIKELIREGDPVEFPPKEK